MPTNVLDAASVGVLASSTLSRPSTAVVLASFERSFCLDVGETLITIGGEDLHDGPLNLRLTGHQGAGFTTNLMIEPGQRFTVSSYRLQRTDHLAINFSDAVVWRPSIPNTKLDPSQLKAGLERLLILLQERDLGGDGLLRLALGREVPRNATERAAQPHIKALKASLPRWLLDDPAAAADPAIQLLGLGPGLTPSGDDLLAGILIVWHQIGAPIATDRLGHVLLAAAAARTTPISLAHLEAASQGYGAAPLHDLLQAMHADKPLAVDQALDVAAKIGHSSGLDAIAGMVLALTAWLEVKREALIEA